MEFPGTWVNSSQTLIYRVVPKCACSTIGQIMYHGDHGTFFDGDIHDAIVQLSQAVSQEVAQEAGSRDGVDVERIQDFVELRVGGRGYILGIAATIAQDIKVVEFDSGISIRPDIITPRDTAGFRCAPDTGPME